MNSSAHRLSPKLADWLTKLGELAEGRTDPKSGKPKHEPIKVAILDNGILSISPASPEPVATSSTARAGGATTASQIDSTNLLAQAKPVVTGDGVNLGSHKDAANNTKNVPTRDARKDDGSLWWRIKAGRSFVDSKSKFSPWQFPSDPYGTQMANLICAIDPLCQILVARVAEDAFGIKAKSVAKVIEWAVRENVDVISMSFALSAEPDKEIKKKIELAEEKGIVMVCSAHDEGSRIATAYPAAHRVSHPNSLLVLAACDEYGKILRDVERGHGTEGGYNDYDYMLRGQNIPAGVVPYVKSEEK